MSRPRGRLPVAMCLLFPIDDSEPVAAKAEAARGAVVPLDKELQLVDVVDRAALCHTCAAAFDSITDRRNRHALVGVVVCLPHRKA